MWRDQFLPGSFRGIPFLTEQSNYEGGRRTVVHEFAARETPLAEDLGRRARKWDIEAWVIGANYRTERDQLLTALETPGPGTLVHPYFGVQAVQVDSVRVRESTDKGGLAVFSITFLEAGSVEPAAPLLADTVINATVIATASISTELVVSGWQGDDATTAGVAAQTTTALAQPIPTPLAAPAGADAASSVTWYSELATYLTELRTDSAWWLQLITLSWPVPSPLNASHYQRTHTARLEVALVTLRRVLFVALVRRLIVLEIADATLARTLRDSLMAECEQLLYWRSSVDGQGVPASVVQALLATRKTGLVYLGDLLRNLPVYTTLTLQSALPAVVVSYQRFGTPDRANEILERNGLRHPLFVSGTLEVLSE